MPKLDKLNSTIKDIGTVKKETSRYPAILGKVDSIRMSKGRNGREWVYVNFIDGKNEITDTMCGNKISIAPKAFYQVNTPAAEKLYAKAKEFVKPNGKIVLDLYSGAGTIGLSMAKQAKRTANTLEVGRSHFLP